MALAESKVLAALLSLVAALFLVAHAPPFRHHGSSRLRGPGAAIADLLLAALDRLRGVDLVGLATRRNMALLCHAILLLLVLRDAGPLFGASARRRRRSSSAATATCDETAGVCFYSATERSHGAEAVLPTENAAVEGELDRPADVGGNMVSQLDYGRAVVVAADDSNLAEEGAQGEQECGDVEEDLDEMNRRFDAFIADTKKKMRLEALQQPVHVAGE